MRRILVFFLAFLFFLPAAASATTIVTSFYPVWLLTLNLTAGLDDITVRNLAAPETGCLHDYALMPSDMTALSDASALLINGAGMESFLPMILEACPDLPVIDASEGIELLAEEDNSGHAHSHHQHSPEKHGHEDEEDDEEEEGNSHIWLDPMRAAAMAENLANGLISLIPEHSDKIHANLNSLQARLIALDMSLKSAFSEDDGCDVIIMHEAFPYFAEACGLDVIETVDKEPEDNLPASRLVQVIKTVNACPSLPLIIRSTEEDPAVSVLAAETGAPVCALDTLASGPADPPMDYYETVMRHNLDLIVQALSDRQMTTDN